MNSDNDLNEFLKEQSNYLKYDNCPITIVLAAGHGKRIKSEQSKMLHEVWGESTVNRVIKAAGNGLESSNQIIVVGIKARQVAAQTGKADNRIFALQETQNGTGDAARVALEKIDASKKVGDIYILPGDMSLITPETLGNFKEHFEESNLGMTILTGIFEGDANNNYYGRIVRVPKFDDQGNPVEEDEGKVIEIKEHKDILALEENEPYKTEYKGKLYSFSKQDLINIAEYNAGVYAVKFNLINEYIYKISSDNVQGEIYITDLIAIFNRNNLSVGAFAATDKAAVMGFNTKSILYEMNELYREKIWKLLNDIITIEDKDDFFIADEVVDNIFEMAEQNTSLDITVGKGVIIDKNVIIERKVIIKRNSILKGNIILRQGTIIERNVELLAEEDQQIVIGRDSVIGRNNTITGQVKFGANCNVHTGVIIEGTLEKPTIIGDNVTIKGITKVSSSEVESGITIEHSIIDQK